MKKAGDVPAFSLLIHPLPLKSVWIASYLVKQAAEFRKKFLIGEPLAKVLKCNDER